MRLLALLLIALPLYGQMIGRAPFYIASSAALPSVIVGDSVAYSPTVQEWSPYIYAYPVVMTTKGAVSYIKAYIGEAGSGATDGVAAIYASTGGKPGALIGQTSQTDNWADSTWKQFDFAAPVNVTGDTVWVALWANANYYLGGGGVSYGGVEDRYYKEVTYTGTFPDPFGTPDGSSAEDSFGRGPIFMRVQP